MADVRAALGNAADAVEFQDPATAHVTLFYLPATLPADMAERLAEIARTSPTETDAPSGSLVGPRHFGTPERPRVAYLAPRDDAWFRRWNAKIAEAFPEYETWAENALPFTPHATLLRAKDPEAYVRKIPAVEKAVRQALAALPAEGAFAGVALFSADSRTSPEIQTEIRAV